MFRPARSPDGSRLNRKRMDHERLSGKRMETKPQSHAKPQADG
ncbi:MAG TPA: hypothetical protein VMJ32_10030 [Pirellulales bacterium]|nr:hypothetical protein [Pirellulales bacterium]